MILDLIVGTLIDIAVGLVNALPLATALPSLPIGPAVGLMRTVDSILPVHEVLPVLVGSLTLMGGVFAFRLLLTMWQNLPGKAT